jgi:hypothetical protein
LIVALYTVALLGDRQRSLLVGAVTALGVIATIVLLHGSLELTGVAIRVPLVIASLAFGDTIGSRRALRAAARERAQREAREREDEARRRAADERPRIARELHDTLAQSLVAINVRSGVAVDLHDAQGSAAALEDIKQASATALRDLRATLGLLRDQHDGAPTAPASDLQGLPGLVDHARSAGLRADAMCRSTAPPSRRRSAERPFGSSRSPDQRAAPRRRVERARARPDEPGWARHRDHRRRASRPRRRRPGLGLGGMAERVKALAGRLDVDPREEGGWRIHAVLPLGGANRR